MRLARLAIAGASTLTLAMAAFAAHATNKNGPTDGGIGFQRSVTPVMDSITSFNNHWLVPIMVGIVGLVTSLMVVVFIKFRAQKNSTPSKTTHNTMLEVVWTLLPVITLMAMAVPSMKLLYFQDVIRKTDLVVKVTGNTWYWEYAYPDHENVEPYTSNIIDIPTEEKFGLSHEQIIAKIDARPAGEPKLNGRPYLFAADAPLVVPVDTMVKVLVTSNNNLHSFAMPQFGIKIDAIPGRINETWFKVHAGEEGTYYGQCSELCGVNHSFMPIEIKVVSKQQFANWLANDGTFTALSAHNSNLHNIEGAGNTVAAK